MAPDAQTTEPSVDYLELLEHEEARLKGELADLGFGDAGGLTYDANFADTSQVTAERREAETLAGELSDSLTDVQAAIARLAEGTYGRCQVCGEAIAAARLEAMPAASRCIACAGRS